ncbi:MAG: sodium-translocating pyrophosphatase [Planctomycetes bacterium]|nr:sodium-translocating pyrophosphatase [Planctomycetota bacterium]
MGLVVCATAGPAWAQADGDGAAAVDGAATVVANSDHALRAPIPGIWYIAPVFAIVALMFARKFYSEVMAADEGDENMIKIASYVREGAMAYLSRQYKVVFVVFVVLAAVLAFMAYGLHVQHKIVWFAFLTGGFFSGLCGYLGMRTATIAAHRTTAGARESLNRGLVVAFRAGAVMGLVVVGFALIDITAWFYVLNNYFLEMSLNEITVVMLTFGMGASTQALFARVGGGIYTKAADVGADLVGKVEAGIPEDDARNPATIADNVGDNVGDVAGMGADLYESYAGSILATAALGVAAAAALSPTDAQLATDNAMKLLSVPMVLAGVGIVLSILGIYMVRTQEGASMGQLMSALGKGVNGSSVMIAGAAYGVCYVLLKDVDGVIWYGVASSVVVGLTAGIIIGKATEYYTSYEYKPTQEIAGQAETGPATVIIAGVAEGMKSTWASLATIIVAIMLSFICAGGGREFMLGLYGVGIAAVGMLATLGITLATDAYGPIADNAGGNAEMTNQAPEVRERTDALDSLGNTTAATGKGFAIGSAALTALALLAAYVEEVRVGQQREAMVYVQKHNPEALTNDAAGMEDIYYIGYGKFAQKWKEGTGEGAYQAYMMLNRKAHSQLTIGDKFPASELGTSDETSEFVYTAMVGDTECHLVNTRRASMQQYMLFYDVTLMNPKVLCGMFSGVLLAFLFCALTMKAVGRAAYDMMQECRRQFDVMRAYLRSQGKDEAFANDPENWPREQITHEGQDIPDYANCVAISTAGAQKEMIFPSLLAIIIPVVVGLIFGVPGVMGMLAGGLTSGFAVAIFMANAGGAWDNAKKWIETGKHGGKGSEAHKASVVGDTVGDPFKDTSGPSLNILIKLMSMVSVVFAGLIVKYAPQISSMLGL